MKTRATQQPGLRLVSNREAPEAIAEHPLKGFLHDRLEGLRQSTGSTLVHISIWVPSTKQLSLVHAVGEHSEYYDRLHAPSKQGLTWECAQKRRVLMLEDVSQQRQWLDAVEEARKQADREYQTVLEAFQSEIAVPLFGTAKELVAVVNLHHPRKKGYDIQKTRRLVQRVFKTAIAAIENAAPFEDYRVTFDWYRERRNALSRLMNKRGDVSLWEAMVQEARKFSRADVVALWMLDSPRGRFLLAASSNRSLHQSVTSLAEDGSLGKVYEEKSSQYWSETQSEQQSPSDAQSHYALPLTVGGQLLGVLCCYSYRKDAFLPQLREELKEFADSCSLLLSRAIVEIEKRVAEEWQIAFRGTYGSEDPALAVVSLTRKLIGAEGVSLFLVSRDRRTLDLEKTTGLAPEFDCDTNYPLSEEEGITPWVVVNEIPIRVVDCGDKKELACWSPKLTWKGRTREVQSSSGFQRPLLIVPIHCRLGTPIGALRASGKSNGSAFTFEDQLACLKLADCLAHEIERPRALMTSFVEELQKNRSNKKRCYEIILNWGLELTGAHAGNLSLGDKDPLKVVVYRGELVHPTVLEKAQSGDSVTSLCHREGVTQVVDDVHSKEWSRVYKSCFAGTASEMAQPITYFGHRLGVINLESEKAAAFREEQVSRVEALANISAQFLFHYQLDKQQSGESERSLNLRQEVDKAAEDTWRNFRGSTGQITLPESCGVEAFVLSRPLESVGGDFHRFIPINDSSVGILLGDGMSHGLNGALHMMPFLAAFDTCGDYGSTSHVVSSMDKFASAMEARASILYAVITRVSPKEWCLSATCAAHPQLLVVQGNGSLSYLPDPDLGNAGMIGAKLGLKTLDSNARIKEGDLIVVYTDGLYEKAGLDSRQAQLKIPGAIASVVDSDLKQIAETLEQWALEQANGQFGDDVTIIALRVR